MKVDYTIVLLVPPTHMTRSDASVRIAASSLDFLLYQLVMRAALV
jgi:hypothetical protein